MRATTSNSVPRLLARVAVLVGCVLAVSVCGEQGRFPTSTGGGGGGGGTSSDVTAPVVTIVLPAPPHDTVQDITDSLKFTVADTDNVKLKSVSVTVSGRSPYSFTFIDSANVGAAGYSKAYAVALKRGAPGNWLIINAIALDAAGNLGQKVDTIRIVDQKPPTVTLVSPSGSTTIGAGSTLRVVSSASDPSGLRYQGARLFTLDKLNQRDVLVADTNFYPAAPATTAPGSKTDTISVRVPATTVPGTYSLQTFARDSSPTPNDTVSVNSSVQVITVLPPGGKWVFPPVDTSVVAGDSFPAYFDATDSAGVQSVAFTGYSVHGDSSLGTFTTTPRYTAVGAAFTTPLPDSVRIRRYFKATTDSSVDSAFISATVTNVGGLTSTIRRRIQVVRGRFAIVTAPANGSYQPVGAGLTVGVAASAPDSLVALGFYVKRNPSVIRDSLPVLPHLLSASSTLLLPAWLRNYGANPQLAIGSVDTIVPFAYGKTSGYFEGRFVTVVNVGAQITVTAPATVIAGDTLRVTSVRVQESLLQLGITSVTMYVNAIRTTNVPCAGCADTVSRYQSLVVNLASALPVDTLLGPCVLLPVLSDSTAEAARLVIEVRDRAGSMTRSVVPITILAGPKANVTAPATGSHEPMGLPLSVTVAASDTSQLTAVGMVAHGVVRDSQTFAVAAYRASHTFVLTVPPRVTPGGVDSIFPFAVGTLHPQFLGKPIVVAFVDTVKPGVTIQAPAKSPVLTVAVGDSVLVQTHVTDNTGVVRLDLAGVARRGSVALGTDSVVTRYTARTVKLPQSTDTVITRYLRAATPLDSTGEFVFIIATATDSSGNTRADTSQVRVVSGPRVSVFTPADSSVTSPGKLVTVTVHARGGQGVRILGWRATGVASKSDSVIASPSGGILSDTLTFTSVDTIPAGTPAGQISITAFAVDSTGNPSAAITPVTVFVQPVGASDVTPPYVTFSVPLRVEVSDSVTVTATDPSGITKIGFIARDSVGTVLHGDSATFSGASTFISQKFKLGLNTITTFPRVVTVEAFAVDGAATPNRGVSSVGNVPRSSSPVLDTLTVVAGRTISFPQGGQFGDAIVDPNNQTLYLTNTLLDQVEAFNLATKTFGTPIRVGSQPVGIALWPKDTLGANRDTLIVANSGGTNLSIVDAISGAEVARRSVPNWSLATVKTVANGVTIDTVITSYELADRPQYVGATCRAGGATPCDSVIAIYSTTPTGGQPAPFTSRGYVAWENITAPLSSHGAGHLFWEQAPRGTRTDSLEIIAVRDVVPGVAIRDTIVGFGAGLIVDINQIAFQDSTFVRNSGNFVHALLGEGGLDQGFARALMYDETKSISTVVGTGCNPAARNCQAQVDAGVSPAAYVTDFLVNHASPVRSISTNFNGRTNLIRADSIYAFDWTLKQTGLMQLPSGRAGMDFDPNNAFDAATRTSPGLNKNDRLVFAARPDASIDVFDTYWYQRVATIPIRDTVIGPIRVASSGGSLILAGVTSRGVVVVTLPSLANPFPAARMLPVMTQAQPAEQVQPARAKRSLGARP